MSSSSPSEGTSLKDDMVQRADLDVINEGPDKAVQIWNVTGRRLSLAAGNSNGDLAVLEFTQGPAGQALRLRLVHDDGAREFECAQEPNGRWRPARLAAGQPPACRATGARSLREADARGAWV
jgi:hypothetical protein